MAAAARSENEKSFDEMGRYQRRRRILLALLIGALCFLLALAVLRTTNSATNA